MWLKLKAVSPLTYTLYSPKAEQQEYQTPLQGSLCVMMLFQGLGLAVLDNWGMVTGFEQLQ